jgi:hypothetical protein
MLTALTDWPWDSSNGEKKNVASEHPEVVTQLTALGDGFPRDLGDTLTGVKRTGLRAPGCDEPGPK